ncbi:MAG: hypothetical protein VX100_07275 [Pseudomonadota bacterium]|nr:hypothetical protein [Pseudomonadota bacterium]
METHSLSDTQLLEIVRTITAKGTDFNPITNDGDCFELMTSQKVELNFGHKFFTQAVVFDKGADPDPIAELSYWSDGCSHNRAICEVVAQAYG